jgi:hypothetical protein
MKYLFLFENLFIEIGKSKKYFSEKVDSLKK